MSRSLARLGASEVDCITRANNSAQVSAIDALISDLTKNWKPTGFYRPEDVQSVLATLDAEAQAVGSAIAAAPLSTSDSQEAKDQAFNDILSAYTDRSKGFAQAIVTARSQGATAINAPGFKDFVIKSMRAISDGYVTAAVLQCRQTWIESILDRGYRAMAAIGAIAASTIGIIVKAGEQVVDASETLAKILAFAIKAAPYAAVGLGGLWIYGQVRAAGGLLALRKRITGGKPAGTIKGRARYR